MRILADEHVPPAFVAALRGEDHDVVVVGRSIAPGTDDRQLFDLAIETDRVVPSADADFRGASGEIDVDSGPGVLACNVDAAPGDVASAVRRIDSLVDTLDGTVLFVPDDWV